MMLLNGQTFGWKPARVGFFKDSILGSLFFQIYVDDIFSNLSTSVKIFADDTSLFPIINDASETFTITAYKVSVCEVFLARIFPHSDQKNSEYGRFLRNKCE